MTLNSLLKIARQQLKKTSIMPVWINVLMCLSIFAMEQTIEHFRFTMRQNDHSPESLDFKKFLEEQQKMHTIQK
jgi:hypothetical protein